MAIDLGKALLGLDYNKDIRAQNRWAQEEASKSGLGGNIGGLLGGLLPMLLLSGTLGPVGMALAAGAGAGLGSFGGSKLGGAMVPDVDTKFGQGTLIDLQEEIKDKQLADAISAGGTAATMSYMGGLGGADTLTPAQQSIVDESVLGATDVTMPTVPDTSSLGKVLAEEHASQLKTAQTSWDKLNPPGPSGSPAGRPSLRNFQAVDPATVNLQGTEWDTSFIKEYDTLLRQDAANLKANIPSAEAPEFWRQNMPSGNEYLAQVEKAQTAWQKQGGDAAFDVFDPGYNPTGPYKKGMGLWTDEGENLLNVGQSWDKMKGFGGQGMDWMQQHPYMSAGLGGGGLLALMMMMQQRNK